MESILTSLEEAEFDIYANEITLKRSTSLCSKDEIAVAIANYKKPLARYLPFYNFEDRNQLSLSRNAYTLEAFDPVDCTNDHFEVLGKNGLLRYSAYQNAWDRFCFIRGFEYFRSCSDLSFKASPCNSDHETLNNFKCYVELGLYLVFLLESESSQSCL